MNWAENIDRIAGEHADNVRRIRYRIEEVDDEAWENNAMLGVVNIEHEGDTYSGNGYSERSQ